MKILRANMNWMSFETQSDRSHETPNKARCLHCYREFRTLSNFHPICKSCGNSYDDRFSFERTLARTL
jgi:rRNA maturation endonuclease Nob1